MTLTKHELLPCPFCGTEPIYGGYPYVSIKCPQCRGVLMLADYYDGDLGTLEASWNSRHPQQDVQGLVKALQDLLDDLKERAKWMHFEPQDGGTVLPCGNGVYVAAEQALKSYQEGRG